MGKYDLTPDDDVLYILQNSIELNEDSLIITHALTREEYTKLNKFLTVAGAKWNRKTKSHIFTTPDSKQKIETLINGGSLVNTKKLYQSFYTPEAIASELVELANIEPHMHVLEPSAGNGSIVEQIKKYSPAYVRLFEIDPDAAKTLETKYPDYMLYEGDFLQDEPEATFDVVLMNPPFTGDQDAKHVLHAYKYLADGGVLLAIVSPAFQFKGSKPQKELKELVESNGEIVKELSEGSFSESGTKIKTIIIKITK